MNKQQTETSLADLSVDALTNGFARGDFSPVEAVRACLARIDAFNDTVNAFCLVDPEGAIERARASEKRWREGAPLSPIDGVPATSKDTTMVTGWISTAGSQVLGSDTPATEDSSPVARLKDAGAVLLGLTISPEIGWKGVTDSPRHGVTRNPWDVSKTPGGSSGGAAVAAALGMGCLHVGTDAGGSVRIPAGFTGVFGFKPSFGRVPNYPPSAFSSISHAGPITRTARDAGHMMNVLVGRDVRDWTALPPTDTNFAPGVPSDLKGLKIAYCPAMGLLKPDADIALRVEEAARIMADMGAEIVEVEFDVSSTVEIFETIWHGAVAWRLRGLDDAALEQLDPELLAFHQRPHDKSRLNVIDMAHRRLEFGAHANTFFEDYDVMITPVLPIEAFATGRTVPAGGSYENWWDWAVFCFVFNLTGQPAASVPCGFTRAGLPVGLQIVGRQFDDVTVMRAATAFETALPPIMPDTPRGAA